MDLCTDDLLAQGGQKDCGVSVVRANMPLRILFTINVVPATWARVSGGTHFSDGHPVYSVHQSTECESHPQTPTDTLRTMSEPILRNHEAVKLTPAIHHLSSSIPTTEETESQEGKLVA